jgi:hypothetical protein
LAIKEGNVESVACPSVTCTKRRVDRQNRVREPGLDGGKLEGTDTGAEAKDGAGQGSAGGEVELRLVEEVVGVELRERLEWLKRKKRVENGKRLPLTTRYNQADPKPCHFCDRPDVYDLSIATLSIARPASSTTENLDDDDERAGEKRLSNRHGGGPDR